MANLRPPRPLQRQKTIRRPRHRYTTTKRRGLGWRGRGVAAAIAVVLIVFGWAAVARMTAPTSNTNLNRLDAIIVLGYPADGDGNPTPEQLSRVTEGVREYERGVAPRLIMTGGAVHNGFAEAEVMARTAEADGIPESAIVKETRARDTIENACFAVRIMRAHGWRSAEVISSGYHLPRAGLIFGRMPVEWRTHAAPALEPESAGMSAAETAMETLKTVRYLVYAKWAEKCEL